MSKTIQQRWSRAQIRAARKVRLEPLLLSRGCQLRRQFDGNTRLIGRDDLIIREHYWRSPSKGIGGNAIDFFMQIEDLSFQETMFVLIDHIQP